MACAVRCCACQNDSVMPARTTRWFQVQPALQRSSRHGRDGPTTCCSLAPMSPEANPRHVTKCCPIRWPIAQGQTRITVWLPVRVLPGPPCSPTLTEISRGLTSTRGFAGRRAGLQSLQGLRGSNTSAPGDGSADQVLARIARALRDRDPKLTQAQAVLKASSDPEFVAKNREETTVRMIRASRLYG